MSAGHRPSAFTVIGTTTQRCISAEGTMITILAALVWIGCSESLPSIQAWSDDPDILREQCESTNSPELQTTCWVQLAAVYGRRGKEFELDGIKACAEIAQVSISKDQTETQKIWEWECAFRLGEELSTAGDLSVGLKHCSMAGRFSQN